MRQLNWTRTLTILLVILVSYALIYITFSILLRFRQAILLFVLGAIVAYILTPLVNRLETVLPFRWVGILISYILLALAISGLVFMLFTPFIDQSKSLVDNLHDPSASSLKTISLLEKDAKALQHTLKVQATRTGARSQLTAIDLAAVDSQVAQIRRDALNVKNGTVSSPSHTPRVQGRTGANRLPPYPQPQTAVPPSYVDAVLAPLNRVSDLYHRATQDPTSPDRAVFLRSRNQAKKIVTAAQAMSHTVSTTPILLLRAQTWLDQHGLHVDIADKFGQAGQQLSNQGTLVLDNAITILQDAANALLNVTLILIIAFYLLMDGPRIIHRGMTLLPTNYREQGEFFLSSVDRVLGGYIRGQLFLSVLAGVLGGGGAAVLGVPYPLLIGIITSVLEAVPVIGPMVAVVPAVLISIFFTMPIATTIALFVWYIVFQQIVTNILGPRIMGMSVGIHPLEALLAVLVGYPIGGFLGAFLAVPVAGVVHILLREAYLYFAPKSAMHPVRVATGSEDMPAGGAIPARGSQRTDATGETARSVR
ncbi:MAG: hypothetical protein PVSMB7_17040 [Chloroflexota bacterium]